MASPTTVPAETYCGIRTNIRKKVTRVLTEVTGEWKVLVLDEAAARILASGMKVHDIMEFGITLVEDLGKPRQPLPRSPGVYFLTPTEANIDKMIADWTNPKVPQMYGSAHVLLTNRVSEDVVRKISSSAMGPYLKTLKEVLIEFSAVDRFAYRIHTPQDLFKFFSNADTRDITKACGYLATFLHTMGDVPNIRFMNTSTARSFAMQLTETVEFLTRLDPAYQETDKAGPGSTLLVLDRSIDCCAPLMHELTYNCFLQDVYPLEDMKYTHTIKTKEGTTTEKVMLLDDQDQVWMKLHHMHIADASKEVDKAFNEFKDANQALNVVGKKGDKVSTRELADAVHSMPQMQERMSRFSMHMDILRKLNVIFRENALEPVVALEQRLVTGEMEDGSKPSPKDLENDFVKIMKDDLYGPEIKTRLFLLFAMTQGLPSQQKREQYLQMAQLSSIEDSLIDKLTALGVKMTSERRFFGKKKAKKVGGVKEGAYDLSRYETAVKGIVDAFAKDSLSNTEYSFVKEPPSSNKASTSGAGGAKTLRTGAGWSSALGGAKPGAPTGAALKPGDRVVDVGGGVPPVTVHGPRLYVFIVGGVTHAEIRGAYEVLMETKREVYIGGTNVITPSDFVNQVGMLMPAST